VETLNLPFSKGRDFKSPFFKRERRGIKGRRESLEIKNKDFWTFILDGFWGCFFKSGGAEFD
jgi:hypothetical protein